MWEDRFTFYTNQIRIFWIWKRRVDSSHQAYSTKNGLLILSHFGYGPKCKINLLSLFGLGSIHSKTKQNKNLDRVLKSRDITLLTEVHIVKAMVFSSSHVQMWELDHTEGWALKNWCFLQWYWRMLLRVPWRARRSNQSILKEINSEYSLEGLMLKLKFQYFGHLMQRADSLEKTLMLGKIEGRGE